MYKLFISLTILSTLVSCGGSNKKQRDVRKISWYEVHADGKGKTLTIMVREEFLAQRQLEAVNISKKISEQTGIQLQWQGATQKAIMNSLEKSTQISLVEIQGADLSKAVKQGYLLGPIDRLIPNSKSYDTDSDKFRASEGFSSQGFAVPCVVCAADSAGNKPFFAIPNAAGCQAAAMIFLDYMLAERAGRE
jgi:spermidine/putrescine-binding protein